MTTYSESITEARVMLTATMCQMSDAEKLWLHELPPDVVVAARAVAALGQVLAGRVLLGYHGDPYYTVYRTKHQRELDAQKDPPKIL